MPWFLRKRGGEQPQQPQLHQHALASRPLLETPAPPALSLQHLVRLWR